MENAALNNISSFLTMLLLLRELVGAATLKQHWVIDYRLLERIHYLFGGGF